VTYFPFKLYYLEARLKTKDRKKIFFYPEKPIYYHALYQICHFSGFSITDKSKEADFVVNFEDTTYRKKHAVLDKLHKKNPVINYACRDISKVQVDKAHKKVFGYSISINPKTYKGKYVKKGNVNSLHNGILLDKPEAPEKGYVYQLLVNNVIKKESVEMRVPVFGTTIPFIYLKYRPLHSRFGSFNNRVELVKPEKLLSPAEYTNIIAFCREMGLDCGELDILRDKVTKKIYIVDVNNTPSSPPFQLPQKYFKTVLRMMSEAFQSAFTPQTAPANAQKHIAGTRIKGSVKSIIW
jgi:hypothetical protein